MVVRPGKKKTEKLLDSTERMTVQGHGSVLTLAKEHIDAAYAEATIQLVSALNTARDSDQKSPKFFDELQEETIKRLNNKKKQSFTEFSTALSSEYESKRRTNSKLPADIRSRLTREKTSESFSVNLNFVGDPYNDPPSYLPTLVEWCWNDDRGGFTPYDTQTTFILEREYQKDKKSAVKLTHGFYGNSPSGYIVDFETMKQIKVESGFERTVQRRMNWIKVDEHKKKGV